MSSWKESRFFSSSSIPIMEGGGVVKDVAPKSPRSESIVYVLLFMQNIYIVSSPSLKFFNFWHKSTSSLCFRFINSRSIIFFFLDNHVSENKDAESHFFLEVSAYLEWYKCTVHFIGTVVLFLWCSGVAKGEKCESRSKPPFHPPLKFSLKAKK